MAGAADAFLLLIIACIFPPIAVALLAGCGPDLCINILLTMLGWLPGAIHAFWLVLRRAEANEKYGRNNWTYTGMGDYVPSNQGAHPGSAQGQVPPPPPPPPPPPTSQYPAANQPQAPIDQKQPVDEKPGGAPPPPAADQKSQAPPQGSEKAVQVVPPPPPAYQTPAESSGT